jgi:hypothetical protein
MLDLFIKYAVLLIVIAGIVCLGLFEVLKELGKLLQARVFAKFDARVSAAFNQVFDW